MISIYICEEHIFSMRIYPKINHITKRIVSQAKPKKNYPNNLNTNIYFYTKKN